MTPVFLELYVKNIAFNITFFTTIFGFTVVRDEGNFAELHLGSSIVLLNASASDVKGHVFHKKINPETNGIGVEIGIFVDDIDSVYKKAKEFKEFKSISELKRQDWGMTDFRILTKDNYYIRVTTKK